MSTWRVLWRLLIYEPRQYALNMVLWTAFWTMPLLTGLVTRAIFNAITRGAQVGPNLWGLLALLVGVAAGRIAINLWGVSAWATFTFYRVGLLRRNLLIYGLGGIIVPFIGIKLIDLFLGLVNFP